MKATTQQNLRDSLARHFGEPQLEVEDFKEPSTGWSRHTFSLTARLGLIGQRLPLIVQVQRENSLILDSNVGRDFAILNALADSDVPVPRTYYAEPDATYLGGPFVVVEQVAGKCFDLLTSADRTALAEHWHSQSRLPASLVDSLIAIHGVDVTALSFLTSAHDAANTANFEIARCRAAARSIGMESDPYTAFALAWLDSHQPSEAWLTLVHGDFHMRNVIVSGDQVAGIIDWELARVSNPLMDLAHLCIPYTVGKFFRPGSPLAAGIVPQDWLLREYMGRTHRTFSPETFRFWRVVATLDLLLIVSAGVSVHARGQASDMRSGWLRFAELSLREDLLAVLHE